jgi:hypothetical protein
VKPSETTDKTWQGFFSFSVTESPFLISLAPQFLLALNVQAHSPNSVLKSKGCFDLKKNKFLIVFKKNPSSLTLVNSYG